MQKYFTLFSLKKRILAVLLCISFIFCALVVRLFVLQIVNGSSLQLRATDQWTRDLAIVAPRGSIYDRTGSTLAVSYTTYNVYVRAREVTSPSKTATLLSQTLDLDFSTVYQKVSNRKVSEVLIKMQVDGETAEIIYNYKLDGVYLAENSDRYYPNGNLLTQVLGFISVDNVGQTGVEAYYNDYLKGSDGYSYVQSDLQGKEIGGSLRYYYPASAGSNLTLTIDSKMQLIVEQTLEQIMEEQKANGADITAEDINALRTGLMGPMAGIGDTVSQSVAYPILAGICCSFALDGNYLGPFLFEVMYKFLMIFCGYNCFMLGYKQGRSAIVSLLQSGTLNRITEAFSIIGLAVVGNMAYSRVTVSCPLAFTVGQVDVVVQDMFDTLLPGIIPLLITLAVWWMISKKKMNPTAVIAVIFVFGIVCSLLGILAQTA